MICSSMILWLVLQMVRCRLVFVLVLVWVLLLLCVWLICVMQLDRVWWLMLLVWVVVRLVVSFFSVLCSFRQLFIIRLFEDISLISGLVMLVVSCVMWCMLLVFVRISFLFLSIFRFCCRVGWDMFSCSVILCLGSSRLLDCSDFLRIRFLIWWVVVCVVLLFLFMVLFIVLFFVCGWVLVWIFNLVIVLEWFNLFVV